MARARNIKPGFFHNEQLVEVSFAARLLFIGLWTIADREGRLEDRPRRIKMQLFPADDLDVDAELNALHDIGVIVRYKCGDNRYIQVLNFTKHQHPHIKEAASTIPAPDESGASPVQEKDKHETSPAESLLLNTESLNSESLSSCSRKSSQAANASSTEERIKPEYEELAALLDERKRENNPDVKPADSKQLWKWAHTVRLMIEQDNRNLDQIRAVLEWSQRDDFWRTNVLSMDKLRKQFDQLVLKSGLIASNGTRGSPAYRKRSVDPDEFRRRVAELENQLAESQHEKDQ